MPDPIRPSLKGPRHQKQNAAGRPKQKKKKPASLKNQIRAIERLSRKEGLDARIRKKEQARLQQLREAAEARKAQELERKYAVRYHKIRFFERVKLERRIKQLERELKCADASSVGELHAKLTQAREDLQYVVNFPKGEKYVSLLRNAEDPEAQKVLEAERTRLRTKVQQQMADIAMITQADEGNPRLLKQPAQPVASPIPQQDKARLRRDQARLQDPDKAALHEQASKRKASPADQPEQSQAKNSEAPAVLASQDIGASPAMLSRASRQTAGVPASDGVPQKGRLAVGNAEPADFDEDDFFMSSSASEVDGDKPPAILNQPLEFPGATMHETKFTEQRGRVSDAMPQKHSKQGKGIQHGKKLPPGQPHADRGHKPHKRVDLPPVRKAMKPIDKDPGAAKAAAHGRPRVVVRGPPTKGRPHSEAASAVAKKQSPGAPEKRPGLPLRSRAEGGRKRRKKA